MRAWQRQCGDLIICGYRKPGLLCLPICDHRRTRGTSITCCALRPTRRGSREFRRESWRVGCASIRMISTDSRPCVPPLPEQAAIVRFLDHADRRIRRYIRAKQKLIKLLEEQKQAIIHRAVTRGLDPNVRLKPSGVEWLGDVPEHWEVKRLYQITNPNRPVMYGIVLPGPSVDQGVYIVKGGNCEVGRLRPDLLARTTFEIESRHARSRLAANDVVFAIRGGVGAAELVPAELQGANLTQDAARIAPGKDVHPLWLLHAVRSPVFREHVKSQVVGATVRGINIRSSSESHLCYRRLRNRRTSSSTSWVLHRASSRQLSVPTRRSRFSTNTASASLQTWLPASSTSMR